jgi:RNA polymerase sigma factor (sigma-70 family)
VISDQDLISGCLKNKRPFQKALYDKYAPVLLGICFRYFPDVDKANDVLQEVFIKVFRSLASYKNEGSFEGWLKRITVNTAINMLRAEKKYKNHEDLENVQLGEEPKYDDSAFILAEVAGLSERFRVVFSLFSIEGYSSKETSEILGISETNVRVLNHRAKKILQERLEKYYLER